MRYVAVLIVAASMLFSTVLPMPHAHLLGATFAEANTTSATPSPSVGNIQLVSLVTACLGILVAIVTCDATVTCQSATILALGFSTRTDTLAAEQVSQRLPLLSHSSSLVFSCIAVVLGSALLSLIATLVVLLLHHDHASRNAVDLSAPRAAEERAAFRIIRLALSTRAGSRAATCWWSVAALVTCGPLTWGTALIIATEGALLFTDATDVAAALGGVFVSVLLLGCVLIIARVSSRAATYYVAAASDPVTRRAGWVKRWIVLEHGRWAPALATRRHWFALGSCLFSSFKPNYAAFLSVVWATALAASSCAAISTLQRSSVASVCAAVIEVILAASWMLLRPHRIPWINVIRGAIALACASDLFLWWLTAVYGPSGLPGTVLRTAHYAVPGLAILDELLALLLFGAATFQSLCGMEEAGVVLLDVVPFSFSTSTPPVPTTTTPPIQQQQAGREAQGSFLERHAPEDIVDDPFGESSAPTSITDMSDTASSMHARVSAPSRWTLDDESRALLRVPMIHVISRHGYHDVALCDPGARPLPLVASTLSDMQMAEPDAWDDVAPSFQVLPADAAREAGLRKLMELFVLSRRPI